ncbi:MAG: cobalamin B12-binding domain-containing protein [Deltaproteobacteria bacterium]|nr:cobalamin B12-binding domain-containing protein [Deltaproteobacteria bacterium]
MPNQRRARILIGKPGLDGHDRGAKIIARLLRDHGFEVIYTGLHQTPEMIVSAALQEDVDAVGLSVLSGAHKHQFPLIRRLLDEKGMKDVILFGGGIIPPEDIPALREAGVRAVFLPGASTEEIIRFIETEVEPHAARRS